MMSMNLSLNKVIAGGFFIFVTVLLLVLSFLPESIYEVYAEEDRVPERVDCHVLLTHLPRPTA